MKSRSETTKMLADTKQQKENKLHQKLHKQLYTEHADESQSKPAMRRRLGNVIFRPGRIISCTVGYFPRVGLGYTAKNRYRNRV